MDRIKKIRIVALFVCYGLPFYGSVGLPVALAGDLPSNAVVEADTQPQEKSPKDNVGRIDFIGETSVTINDQGYDLTSLTKYRTAGGGVTGRGHFAVGDAVQFMFDSQEMMITELQMHTRSEKESNTKEKRKTGMPVLKNGVWTN